MSGRNSPWKRFTLSGDIGSGKSSVARQLSAATGAEFHSTGSLQRRLAGGRQLSTLELNLLSESEPTIDAEIDGFTKELARSNGSFVIDSRLAWHFVPDALKVFLVVDTLAAAHRVITDLPSRGDTESYEGADEAVRDIVARQESERRRFRGTYGVDLFRWSNYDLVIDTSEITAERAVELILDHGAEDAAGETRLWLAPRSVYPTQETGSVAGAETEEMLSSMRAHGFSSDTPVEIIAGVDRGFYVLNGHRRLSCALRLGLPIIPGRLVGQGDDEVAPGTSVQTLLAAQPRRSWLSDWEEAHGFTFAAYPPEPAQPVDAS